MSPRVAGLSELDELSELVVLGFSESKCPPKRILESVDLLDRFSLLARRAGIVFLIRRIAGILVFPSQLGLKTFGPKPDPSVI